MHGAATALMIGQPNLTAISPGSAALVLALITLATPLVASALLDDCELEEGESRERPMNPCDG